MSRAVPRPFPPWRPRRLLRSHRCTIGLLAALTLLSAACAGGSGGAQGNRSSPRTGGELRILAERDLNHLDPLWASTVEERAVLPQMYDTLIRQNQSLGLVPGLATSWHYAGPTTLVLTLRHGVTFADGTEVDAAAAKFSLDREMGTVTSPRHDDLSSLASVATDGSDEVVLHLKRPDSALLSTLAGEAGMIVSPQAVRSAPSEASFDRNPIGAGAGPFTYYEWRRDDHLIMLANGRYWGQKPYVRQVNFEPNPNLHSQLDDLRNGFQNVQRTIARDDIPAAQRDPALSVSWEGGTEYTGIELNSNAGPFTSADDRRAVAAAVDRRTLVDRVLLGVDTPAYGVIAPRSWAYDPSISSSQRTLSSPAPRGFSFTLKTDTLEQDLAIAGMLQSQLRSAGIDMRIQPEDAATLHQELEMHRFQAALVDVAGGQDPDQSLYKQFRTGGSLNYGQFTDATVDSDLDGARLASNQAQRKALYDDAQRRLIAAAGFIPLTFPPAFDVHDWQVHGYAMYPNGTWRLNTVWLS